ncbi:MAG: MATE family efflux transporter [Negativicutes bacterium]|nr:MATE family efflux transporter [Negativicutes bacterium]
MQESLGITWKDHKNFISLAVPLIIASLTTPLLGVVDTAIMGRFPQAAYIGGVSVAVLIFNTLYWALGFLRVSTAGFSAQASGSKNSKNLTLALLRPLAIAWGLGFLIVALQWPIKEAAFSLLNPSKMVGLIASDYYDVRIWSAPFTLTNYVIVGWLMGLTKIRLSLTFQVAMNILNILLAVVLVMGFGFAAQGVATATLVSEIFIAVVSLWVVFNSKEISFHNISLISIVQWSALVHMMKMNRDLFIRTICMIAVYNMVTAYGMRYGDSILAGNAILMQIHFLMANFLGGIGNAGTVIAGKSIGQKNRVLFYQSIYLTAIWGAIMASILTGLSVLFQSPLIGIFTNLPAVLQAANDYFYWILFYPLLGFWGLGLFGIFVGATTAGPIRNSLVYSLIVFLLCLWLSVDKLGNNAIWLSFTLFNLARSLFLWKDLSLLKRSLFKNNCLKEI